VTDTTHQLNLRARFGNSTRALIVDGHGTARQMLAAQLRSMGASQVVQCARAAEARQHAATRAFEIVLCEQKLGDGTLGQDLIDDLRQRRLINLSTIVMVLSANSSYPVVAEAAELAIDGFLIKPYTLGDLEDRLLAAFVRKDSLKEIAQAIDRSDYAGALALCQQRFEARGPHWTHAARVGAELAIRLERLALATDMFEAVMEDKAVPWARLGIARVMDAAGKDNAAVSTIKNLLGSHPTYADAYDVLGRIYADRGDYAAAADTYRRAVAVTPHSVSRNQKYGILVYYTGDQAESLKVLGQVIERGGLQSPDFDHHVIVLLAVDAFKRRELEALLGLRDKLQKAIEEQRAQAAQVELARETGAPTPVPAAPALLRRLERYALLVQALGAVLQGDAMLAMKNLEANYESLAEGDAAVDAAIAFLLALSTMCGAQVHVPLAHTWVHTVALRYCTSKQVTELLARTCEAFEPLSEPVRLAHGHINEVTRGALGAAVAGEPREAVLQLIEGVEATRNLKLHEVALATLERHRARIEAPEALEERLEGLRAHCGANSTQLLHITLQGL
jgi:DNA-binding response OmpR family regulator